VKSGGKAEEKRTERGSNAAASGTSSSCHILLQNETRPDSPTNLRCPRGNWGPKLDDHSLPGQNKICTLQKVKRKHVMIVKRNDRKKIH